MRVSAKQIVRSLLEKSRKMITWKYKGKVFRLYPVKTTYGRNKTTWAADTIDPKGITGWSVAAYGNSPEDLKKKIKSPSFFERKDYPNSYVIVPSSSGKGTYTVTVETRASGGEFPSQWLDCDCPSRGVCKHIKKVKSMLRMGKVKTGKKYKL